MKTLGDELAKFKRKEDVTKDLKKDYLAAKKNPFFKNIVDQINLADEKIMKYTSLIEECAAEHEQCSKCNSLLECKNKIQGHAFTPVIIDDKIEFGYQKCRYQLEYDKRHNFSKNMKLIQSSEELRSANLKEVYKDDASRLEAIEWIMKFLKNYPNTDKGLFLHGSFGSGKTYLIAAMFNELAKKNVRSAIVYWPEYLRDLKASFNTNFNEKYNYIKDVPVLLIDDIGAENTTDWGRDEVLGPILQHRMQNKLHTFFTSNFDMKMIENHFSISKDKVSAVKSKRIIERINQLTDTIEMVGKNRRR